MMPSKLPMPEKLVAWANERLMCGWSADELIQGMVKVGHANDYSRQFVQAILAQREATFGRTTNKSLASSRFDADPINLPNTVELADRNVSILLALSRPRVILMENLLSDDECDAMIEMSRTELQRAKVVDESTGESRPDPDRISGYKNFPHGATPVVAAIEARIAAMFDHPIAHQEQVQVLHYPVGGQYKPHHDYFEPSLPGSPAILKRGGQRVATVVMYLNDVAEGGGTVFPKLGIEAKPRRGNAVYFESVDAFGQLDPRLLHAGAPVTQGEKWIAVKWIRAEPWQGAN